MFHYIFAQALISATFDVSSGYTAVCAQHRVKLNTAHGFCTGGFEVGNSANTDMRPTVERSIVLGEPVIIVALNYRVSGEYSIFTFIKSVLTSFLISIRIFGWERSQ